MSRTAAAVLRTVYLVGLGTEPAADVLAAVGAGKEFSRSDSGDTKGLAVGIGGAVEVGAGVRSGPGVVAISIFA